MCNDGNTQKMQDTTETFAQPVAASLAYKSDGMRKREA